MSTTQNFSLPGITCASCGVIIETALGASKDKLCFKSAFVDFDKKMLTLDMDDVDYSPEDLFQEVRQVLDEVGYQCEKMPLVEKGEGKRHWILGFIGIGVGILIMSLCLGLGAIPLWGMITIAAISIPLTLFLGLNSYKEAFNKFMKAGTLNMDTLFSVSTLAVIGVSIAAFFVTWLPMMFDVGLLIFGFRHLGVAIEESIKEAAGMRKTFSDRLPVQVIRVLEGHERVGQSLDTIEPGNILEIQPGEIIPVDGFCENEASRISETDFTGSPVPRPIKKSDLVRQGMYLAKDAEPLHLRVKASAAQSHMRILDEVLLKAKQIKAPIQTLTNRTLQYFIPIVLLLAIASGLIVGFLFSPALAILCVVTVLTCACPCALGLVAPMLIEIGMKKAAENGVFFKSMKALEEAEQCDTVVFDLRGTLTKGIFSVDRWDFIRSEDMSDNDFLAYFSIVEAYSKHPLAEAVCEFVEKKKVRFPTNLSITQNKQSHHSGVTVDINQVPFVAGNQKMMEDAGIKIPPRFLTLDIAVGDNAVYLARNKVVIGYMILTDPLREDAALVVQALKDNGKGVYLCTGEHDAASKRYASQLKIPLGNVKSGQSMNEKAAIIQDLKTSGHTVAMVGDAGNDVLAMQACHFGIAIHSRGRDEVTQQEAGAVIQSGSLKPVLTAFEVSQQTVKQIKKTLFASLSYNVASISLSGGLLLAFGVVLNPSVGVILMILQTSLILLNAWRFKEQKLEPWVMAEEIEGHTYTSSYRLAINKMPRLGHVLLSTVAADPAPKEAVIRCQPSEPRISDVAEEFSSTYAL